MPVRSITLIIPALNEEGAIRQTAEESLQVALDHFDEVDMILIDDGSSDRTGAIMDDLAGKHQAIRVLHNGRNLGLGASYKRGVAEARGAYVMLLCGDGAMPGSALPAIFDRVGQADIIIPYIRNLRHLKTRSRYLLSRTYTALLNLVSGLDLHYFNGLPVHRLDRLRSIEIKSNGFGFQAEILVKLIKGGCTYEQVGVNAVERKNQSSALRPRNVISVSRTIARLLVELFQIVRSSKRS